ncbi:hypothetical protein [Thermithiobacillus plumbiphilus]|uniref:Uncharacterized protein n=1 Tax=Thermithiobacillus plumbiphilus TaxID=1729899 RepID=A0ABU9D763_9PROT
MNPASRMQNGVNTRHHTFSAGKKAGTRLGRMRRDSGILYPEKGPSCDLCLQ